MRKLLSALVFVVLASNFVEAEPRLPFTTVFKGRDQFDRLVAKARQENWKELPIGERTATVGRALVGTRYKSYTLEIDNRIEAPSVNFNGMDCWTFYEIALAFARMLNEPEENWTPEQLPPLHRAGPVSWRPMHRRISLATTLSRRLVGG
jgi:hypothetical protein